MTLLRPAGYGGQAPPLAALARYCALAYEDPATVCDALPGARIEFLAHKGAEAYLIEFPEQTVVAFRGTQVTANFSMTDILRNAKIRPVFWRRVAAGRGKVHRGYKEAADALLPYLVKALTPRPKELIYTGHSLGGAVATLLRTAAPTPDSTVTFGAPKVGDREFVRAHAHNPLVRVVHARDIAPKHARPWLGYRHGGTFLHLSREGVRSLRPWRWRDELIIPLLAGLAQGTFDHRIGEYVAKLEGAEL